jgi:hypothetical protein
MYINCSRKLNFSWKTWRDLICLGVCLPWGAHDQIFVFCLKLRGFLRGAPSLTRGFVCNLLVQLLLDLARAAILVCKSDRTHDNILLPHIRLPRPPLWSSGQSSWLQIRRPGFDSRHYQKKKVVGLERGSLSLVSTTEELLDRKVAAPV